MSTPPALHLLLATDRAVCAAQVKASCPPPHHVTVVPRGPLVTDSKVLSPSAEALVARAAGADVLLVEWALDEAPALNTLCYAVRKGVRTPVIMLAPDLPDARAAAIAAGADDAVPLPFSIAAVQARVLSYRRLVEAVRAATPTAPAAAPHDAYRVGALHLDETAHRFSIRGAPVELTPREFALVRFLMTRVDTLCTRQQILDAVWGISFDTGTNMVDVYMYFLRKKLEAHGLKGMIETVRGRGYRLVEHA